MKRNRIIPATLAFSTEKLRGIKAKRLIIKVMIKNNYKIISEKVVGIRE